MKTFLGPETPLAHILAHALGVQPRPYGDAAWIARNETHKALLLPFRETPDAEVEVAHALRAIGALHAPIAFLLSNTAVYDPEHGGLRREHDDPDANDAFGRAIAEAEARFAARWPAATIVRLCSPLAQVEESASLAALKGDGPLPGGAIQVFEPDHLAGLLARAEGTPLVHLACGPVPMEAIGQALNRPVGPETPHREPGWDRLRTNWSDLWGRPDGLATARRAHLDGLVGFLSQP